MCFTRLKISLIIINASLTSAKINPFAITACGCLLLIWTKLQKSYECFNIKFLNTNLMSSYDKTIARLLDVPVTIWIEARNNWIRQWNANLQTDLSLMTSETSLLCIRALCGTIRFIEISRWFKIVFFFKLHLNTSASIFAPYF